MFAVKNIAFEMDERPSVVEAAELHEKLLGLPAGTYLELYHLMKARVDGVPVALNTPVATNTCKGGCTCGKKDKNADVDPATVSMPNTLDNTTSNHPTGGCTGGCSNHPMDHPSDGCNGHFISMDPIPPLPQALEEMEQDVQKEDGKLPEAVSNVDEMSAETDNEAIQEPVEPEDAACGDGAPVKTRKKRMKVDVGKVMALHRAGWGYKDIAEEMNLHPITVQRCINAHIIPK